MNFNEIKKSYQQTKQSVKEAYQYDESNLWYIYDKASGRLKQKMVHNLDEPTARGMGYRDSVDGALKVVGIIRSKFDPKKFVQNQGGKWIQVFPFGQSDVTENAEELHIGDPVIITGKGIEFEGKTGDIDSFGKDKRFVIVNLYNHGRQSFHSSDVSYNEYAGSEEEESRMVEGVDNEGAMAAGQLKNIARKAQSLAMTMTPDKQLDGWVQSLISRAETDMVDVHDFLGNFTQNVDESTNPEDVIQMDVPFLIRVMEYAREDAKTDQDLHFATERMIAASNSGQVLTMDQYESIFNPADDHELKNPIEEADMSSGNQGYDNMLAVMKAVDSGQDATFNLGGEPVTLEYHEARFLAGRYKAFLKAGRQEEFLRYMNDPVSFDRLMKKLRDLMDKQKTFKGSVPGERGIEESAPRVDSLVTNGLKIMRGPTRDDAIAALKTQVGERDFNERRGFYNFYVRQLMDMYGKKGVAERKNSLPAVNENEYWCSMTKKAKLIPEGYKKTANGFITRK